MPGEALTPRNVWAGRSLNGAAEANGPTNDQHMRLFTLWSTVFKEEPLAGVHDSLSLVRKFFPALVFDGKSGK